MTGTAPRLRALDPALIIVSIIVLARGILVALPDGQTIDTILSSLASTLGGAGSTVAAFATLDPPAA